MLGTSFRGQQGLPDLDKMAEYAELHCGLSGVKISIKNFTERHEILVFIHRHDSGLGRNFRICSNQWNKSTGDGPAHQSIPARAADQSREKSHHHQRTNSERGNEFGFVHGAIDFAQGSPVGAN